MSSHTLNTSSSKMKFSFPKTDRFGPTRRSAYRNIHLDATRTMKYHLPRVKEVLPSALETRTLVCVMKNGFLQLELIKLIANFQKLKKKQEENHLEPADRYILIDI